MSVYGGRALKAARLHAQDRVLEIPDARVFQVLGDQGETYTVVFLADDHVECSCPRTSVCSHVGAALLAGDMVDCEDTR